MPPHTAGNPRAHGWYQHDMTGDDPRSATEPLDLLIRHLRTSEAGLTEPKLRDDGVTFMAVGGAAAGAADAAAAVPSAPATTAAAMAARIRDLG